MSSGYICRSEDEGSFEGGNAFMVFPLIGGLISKYTVNHGHPSVEQHIELLLKLRQELSAVSPDVIRGFLDIEASRRQQGAYYWWKEMRDDSFWNMPVFNDGIGAKVTALLELIEADPFRYLDCLQHGDAHAGNIVKTEEGILKLADLDDLSIGTEYGDGLFALISIGAAADDFKEFVRLSREQGSRDINQYDIAHAVARGVIWLRTVMNRGIDPKAGTMTNFNRGFSSLIGFAHTIL